MQQLVSQQTGSQHDLWQQRFMLLHRSRKGRQRGLQQGAGSQQLGSGVQQVVSAWQQVGSQQLVSQHFLWQQRNMSRRRQRGLQQGAGSQHDGAASQQLGSQQLGSQQPCELRPSMRSSISNALAWGACDSTNRAANAATGRTTRVLMGRVPLRDTQPGGYRRSFPPCNGWYRRTLTMALTGEFVFMPCAMIAMRRSWRLNRPRLFDARRIRPDENEQAGAAPRLSTSADRRMAA